MKNLKPILIGTGVLALAGTAFLLFKKKGIADDATGGNIELDFNNASGNSLVDVLNKYKTKKIIPVKKYQNFMSKASLTDLNSFLIGKNIYTLSNSVKVRATPEVNNALINFGNPTGGFSTNNNITGTIPKKGTYVGKVCWIVKDDSGKAWFGIVEGSGNPYIKKVFNWDELKKYPHPYTAIKRYNNTEVKPIRWVRNDVVVVDLSDERKLTNAYLGWTMTTKENM